MANAIALHVDQDWLAPKDKLEPGSILRYIDRKYDKDKQRTLYIFELIGHPVEKPNWEIYLT